MANANKYHFFGVVIDAPKESPSIVGDLRGYENKLHDLNGVFVFLATILHDNDFYDNGEPKTAHLHAFLHTAQDFTRLQALDLLNRLLGIKKEQISIEESNSDLLLVQYLTHQNHPEKAQYKADSIRTNNQERLNNTLAREYKPPKNEAQAILEAIQTSRTLLEFATEVGIPTANKYRATFNQIKIEQGQNFDKIVKDKEAILEDFRECVKEIKTLVAIAKNQGGSLLPRDIEQASAYLNYVFTFYGEDFLD